MTPRDDEFYIGYEPATPPGIGRRLRRAGLALGLGLAIAAGVVLAAHQRLSPSRFDFGRPREVTGRLERRPYPALMTGGRPIWLVGQGKHGAEDTLAHLPDGPVSLHGTPIARGSHTMLEVVAGSASAAAADRVDSAAATAPEDTADTGREVTLTGEIVDGKCFLGVMNPGEGTVHRDCARLCLRGGLPPMLLVRGGLGEEALVVLVSTAGEPIGRALAEIAGVPVTVRGLLIRDGSTLVLRADRKQFQTL
jgi:hypothetical protein